MTVRIEEAEERIIDTEDKIMENNNAWKKEGKDILSQGET